jgi:predicted PurR-regulated permease PerM
MSMPQAEPSLPGNRGWLIIAGVLLCLLWLLAPVLTPFFLAAILAYMLQPLVWRLDRRGVPRSLAVLLILLLEALTLVVLVLTVLPMFLREISHASAQLPAFLDRMDATLAPWIKDKTGYAISLDANSIREQLQEMVKTTEGLGSQVLNSLRLGGLGLLGLLANAVLVPVVQFYLMRDWESMLARVVALIPPAWRPTVRSFTLEADEAMAQYLHGQMLVILVMAIFYTTGLWLTGLEFFLPIGIITGILVFVPYLGSISGFFMATFAAMMQFSDWTSMLWVWGVFVIGQMLEGYVVVPRLVGERIGLHPLAVIFALLAFGQVFGFMGLLLALPASAVLLVALKRMRARYLDSQLFKGGQ